MNSDFSDLLRILNEKRVRYLVVGGYAVIRYTEPRYTKDLDLLIECSEENAAKVIEGLKEFGAPTARVTAADLTVPGVFYQIGTAPNRVDIITRIAGVDFEAAYERREEVVLDKQIVPFISRDDLINAKLAAGRPQDLVDAGALARTRK